MALCKINNCSREFHGKGLCKFHWQKLRKYGDPEFITLRSKRHAIVHGDYALLPLGRLAKDGYAKIDRKDMGLDIHFWHLDASGYPASRIGGRLVRLHKLLLPDSLIVDHLNRDKTDNRLANLRPTTNRENCRNKGLYRHNTSGFTGITLNNKNKRWIAQIKIDGKHIALGTYIDKDDAINARLLAEIKYWGVIYSHSGGKSSSKVPSILSSES